MKVLPIDIIGKYATINEHVYFSLLEDARAKFPEEVMTFVFIKKSRIKVGEYVNKKTKQKESDAEVERWEVTIVDRHTRSILQKRIFTGNQFYLPALPYQLPGPIVPDNEVIKYLNSLLIKVK